MATIMEIRKFSSIKLDDVFFDSLKNDYPGFEDWFVNHQYSVRWGK